MIYMTILHWISVVFFVLVFILLAILASRESDKNSKRVMIISAFIMSIMGATITLFALEKYTKKAKLLSYTQKRMLSTESVIFKGKIKNIGDFKIGECKIEVKFTNNVMTIGRPKSSFFKPSNGFSLFSSDKKSDKPNTIKEEFVVVKNLNPHKIKNFKIDMKYPPYMKAPLIKLKLSCH